MNGQPPTKSSIVLLITDGDGERGQCNVLLWETAANAVVDCRVVDSYGLNFLLPILAELATVTDLRGQQ